MAHPRATSAAPSCRDRRCRCRRCRRSRRRARRSTRGCRAGRPGTVLEVEPRAGVADLDAQRRRRGAATDTASPSPSACCRALATACVAASVSARATRPGMVGASGPTDRATARSTPSSRAAASIASATALGVDRLVAALAGVLLGVGESGERLARHRRGERALARRVGALGGDERGEHAVVHERRHGDALLLRRIRRRRLRVRRDRPRPRLVDVRGDRAEHPAEREDHPAEDQRERHVEARPRTRSPARIRPG